MSTKTGSRTTSCCTQVPVTDLDGSPWQANEKTKTTFAHVLCWPLLSLEYSRSPMFALLPCRCQPSHEFPVISRSPLLAERCPCPVFAESSRAQVGRTQQQFSDQQYLLAQQLCDTLCQHLRVLCTRVVQLCEGTLVRNLKWHSLDVKALCVIFLHQGVCLSTGCKNLSVAILAHCCAGCEQNINQRL